MASAICNDRTPTGRTITQFGVAAALVSSLALASIPGAGQAFADPPQQGGVGPSDQAPPQQGGVGPSDQAPPQQGGVGPAPQVPQYEPTPQAPSYETGPLGLPSAPPAPQSQHVAPQSYQGEYTPIPQAPLHAPNPQAPKVQRIAAGPDVLRIGNFEMLAKDVPAIPEKNKTIDWVNGWASYAEQEVANGLISIGVPPDQAVRQAAATVAAAAAAGAIGGIVTFTATTIAVGIVAIPIGAVIGGGIGAVVGGGNLINIAGGAALGAGGGALVALGAGAAAGTAAAIVAGLGGGIAGFLLGTGDGGDSVKRPDGGLPWEQQGPGKHRQPELPNPDGNQFELHLNKADAQRVGLPAVDYVVNSSGDVNVTVGATNIGWTGEQAQAPIKALGPAAQAAENAINGATRAVTEQAAAVIDGLQVSWPQLEPQSTKPAASNR